MVSYVQPTLIEQNLKELLFIWELMMCHEKVKDITNSVISVGKNCRDTM